MVRSDWQRLLLLVLTALLAGLIGFVAIDVSGAIWVIRKLGLPMMWLTLAGAVFGLVGHLRPLLTRHRARRLAPCRPDRMAARRRRRVLVVAYLALLTLLLHAHFPHQFKVLNDEVVLLGQSQAMHKSREVLVPAMAQYVDGAFQITNGYVDKRPYLFPVVLSLVHDLTGYRTTNSLWLNFALTPVLLGLVFLLGGRIAGWRGAWLAPLLLAGLPLLAQNVTGGGFEVLNLVLLALVGLLGLDLLRERRPATLVAFCYAGALLAFCRYESVLFVPAVGLVVLLYWWREGRPVIPLALLPLPLLLIPYPLIITIVRANYDAFFQLSMRAESDAFALRFLIRNLEHAANFFFHGGGVLLNSTPLFGAGVAGIVGFGLFTLLRWRRGDRPGAVTFLGLTFGGVILLNLLILLCYHWGQIDDSIVARITLPLHLAFALAATWLVRVLAPSIRHLWKVAGFGAAAALYFVALPVAANHHLERVSGPIKHQRMVEDFVAAHPQRDYLVLIEYPLAFLTHEVLAHSLGNARRLPDTFRALQQTRQVSAVYAFQNFSTDPVTGQQILQAGHELPADVEAETIAEPALGSGAFVRISRVHFLPVPPAESP